MCTTILFVQEQLLIIVPNVQFTTLLIVLFSSVFKFRETVAIITVYVFFDNLYMGSFHPLYTPPMFLAWLLIPISYHTVLRRTKSEVKLAVFGFVFGFVYGWVYIPFRILEFGITDLWPYFLADLPFEVIMAVSNFATILWLFTPLHKTLETELAALSASAAHEKR